MLKNEFWDNWFIITGNVILCYCDILDLLMGWHCCYLCWNCLFAIAAMLVFIRYCCCCCYLHILVGPRGFETPIRCDYCWSYLNCNGVIRLQSRSSHRSETATVHSVSSQLEAVRAFISDLDFCCMGSRTCCCWYSSFSEMAILSYRRGNLSVYLLCSLWRMFGSLEITIGHCDCWYCHWCI